MAKPVIIAIDDDSEVLNVITRDLRRQYNQSYRILASSSGTQMLETLPQLKQRNDSVAMLLVDQRMPKMTGIEFLEQAQQIFPQAKRALLTAYADSNAAMTAINKAKIDYYLLKPWIPPEEKLYPVLNDLLEIWQKSYYPTI